MTAQILTKEYLHTLFDYKDGELYWKIKLAKPIMIGDMAGCQDTNGYKKVKINGKIYGNHRIIFAMHYGYFPKQIDHIDRNPKNNKIENLRNATHAENQWNTTKNSRNTSGYKNVLWRKDKKKWTCRFKVNGKHIMRGSFNTAEEANVYAEKLREELHGEYKITTRVGQSPTQTRFGALYYETPYHGESTCSICDDSCGYIHGTKHESQYLGGHSEQTK